MKTKATPELSYFRLKLTAYLRDHQPDLVDDATLVPLVPMQPSLPIAMLWRKASHTPKPKALPAMYSLKVYISQSTTP